jgi:hypothetical protein
MGANGKSNKHSKKVGHIWKDEKGILVAERDDKDEVFVRSDLADHIDSLHLGEEEHESDSPQCRYLLDRGDGTEDLLGYLFRTRKGGITYAVFMQHVCDYRGEHEEIPPDGITVALLPLAELFKVSDAGWEKDNPY